MLRRALLTLIASAVPTIGPAWSQDQLFNSREEFQEKTGYWTIALNRSATSKSSSRYTYKNYIQLAQSGQVRVPSQSGYCFVLNHYNSPNNAEEYEYTFSITKHFSDKRVLKDSYSASYTPATYLGSWSMPDYCLRRVAGLVKVEVVTGSSEPSTLSHKFWFDLPE